MDNEAKIRPFYLAKILYERTDYDHALTTAQLIDILEKEYNIHAHRITIASDIELLKSIGMDIQLIKSSQNQYNVLGRYFDEIELKLLIDAVESSRFISKEKSEKLVEKISALAGQNAANTIKRHISVERRIKSDNEKVLLIADAINMAINMGKQISFQYFEYNVKKQVFHVIDTRYRSNKPLIATTNRPLDELKKPTDTAHSRIYDRLLSMCVPIRFTGVNFRQLHTV